MDQLQRVRWQHEEDQCPQCKEGLCFLYFYQGLKNGFQNNLENSNFKIHLRSNSSLCWDGKGKKRSLYGEEMVQKKVRNNIMYTCNKDHNGCLICRENGINLDKDCINFWTSDFSLIHLYYTSKYNSGKTELTIEYNTRVWNQQCEKCKCFGDKSAKKDKLDGIAEFFGKRILEEERLIARPEPTKMTEGYKKHIREENSDHKRHLCEACKNNVCPFKK